MFAIYLGYVKLLPNHVQKLTVYQDSNRIQQYFSSKKQPTLWRALPALEELQSTWEKKCDNPKYAIYEDALTAGLDKLKKYYSCLDKKPGFVLALGKRFNLIGQIYTNRNSKVLHPYYKLAYIKLAWGCPDEQAAEISGGNPYAKDWQDEAKQIVKRTVRLHIFLYYLSGSTNSTETR